MFIELLMAATLDLSLPEFQPEKDISGNYIELSNDVSNGEVVVHELTQEEFDSSVSEHLPVLDSQPADPTREVYIIKSAPSVRSSNVITVPTSSIYLTISNGVISAVGAGQGTSNYIYVELQPGITYTFDTDAPRVNLTTGFSVNNTYIGYTDPTYTPTQTMYAFVWEERTLNVTYTENVNDDVSGNIDLTTLESNVIQIKSINENTNEKLRILVFISLMNLCLPFLINGLRLVMGGKDSNV